MAGNLATLKVEKVVAGRGFDSRNTPAVFAGLRLNNGKTFFFTVDSGASTGVNEAVELRDKRKEFGGKDVQKAIGNVLSVLKPMVEGTSLNTSQIEFDAMLRQKDGTKNLELLGANAILPLSGAFARARADSMDIPLFQYLNGEIGSVFNYSIPVPFMNVFNAGKHAPKSDGAFPGQEIMIGAVGAKSGAQAVGMGVEVWGMMGKMLKERGIRISIGDEGGYANPFSTAKESFEFIKEAVERAGFAFGREIVLAVDPAASEYFGKNVHDPDSMAHGLKYHFEKGALVSPHTMAFFWQGMAQKYPILSMEDIHAQNDFSGWKISTDSSAGRLQLVGDDLFCTNKGLLNKGIRDGMANSVLIKLNQNGTVYGTLEVMALAMKNKYTSMVSHRSGLGMDDFIAHLSVLTGQIKAGSSRERMLIYNSILQLEQMHELKYAGIAAFSPSVQAYWNATWNK